VKLTLLHDDCSKALPRLPRESVDVVVTSPPYNLDVPYSYHTDSLQELDYLNWLDNLFVLLSDKMKESASFFLNFAGKPTKPMLPYKVVEMASSHFVLQNTIIWAKSISVPDSLGDLYSVGHFRPINSGRFLNRCHEFVFHFTKRGDTLLDRLAIGVPFADKTNVTRWEGNKGRDLRCRGDIWFIPYRTTQEARLHPAQFPPDLPAMCIRLHGCSEETVVLDPLAGLGNTGIACQELSAGEFIGIEIDENYYHLMEKTLE